MPEDASSMDALLFGVPTDAIGALAGLVTAIAAAIAAYVAVRGLHVWKSEMIGRRQAELAEDLLSGFYEARDIFMSARSPGALSQEFERIDFSSIQGHEYEDILKSFYLPVARIDESREILANLHAKRYRATVLFGHDVDDAFDALTTVQAQIRTSFRMMRQLVHSAHGVGEDPAQRHSYMQHYGRLFYTGNEDDEVKELLDQAVADIEKACSSAIT